MYIIYNIKLTIFVKFAAVKFTSKNTNIANTEFKSIKNPQLILSKLIQKYIVRMPIKVLFISSK